MRDVIAIANISQLQTLEVSKLLFQREVVSHRLARVLKVAQRINDGHRRVFRKFFYGSMRKRSQHNQVYPAFQVMRNVTQTLSCINARLGLVDKERDTAETSHSGFEREPGPQRRLLKKHGQLFALESAAKISRARLDPGGQIQQRFQFAGREIARRNEVAAPKPLGTGDIENIRAIEGLAVH